MLDLIALGAEVDSFLVKETERSLNHLFRQIDKIMENTLELNGKTYKLTEVVPEPVKVGRWKPEFRERYWHIDKFGNIKYGAWEICHSQSHMYNIGNCYHTEALAITARDRQVLMVELQDFADGCNAKYEICNRQWYLCRDIGGDWYSYRYNNIIPGATGFDSEVDANKSIAHFGKRLDLLLV